MNLRDLVDLGILIVYGSFMIGLIVYLLFGINAAVNCIDEVVYGGRKLTLKDMGLVIWYLIGGIAYATVLIIALTQSIVWYFSILLFLGLG